MNGTQAEAIALLLGVGTVTVGLLWRYSKSEANSKAESADSATPVLPCLRDRRSVFPRSYVDRRIDRSVVQSLLDAAMWAPFHGSVPPWRFVVLGQAAFVEMQRLTLQYYDANWREVGWANGQRGSEEQYLSWRQMTEDEICGMLIAALLN